ncbi:MAG: T9SS type A sorting domain-containing protein, partial [Bacteroidota bacterium]
RAFPNPTSGTLHVRGKGNKEHAVQLRLFNALGALVTQQQFPAGEALILTEMDLGQLTPGIYFLKIDSGPEMITQRIIKQ